MGNVVFTTGNFWNHFSFSLSRFEDVGFPSEMRTELQLIYSRELIWLNARGSTG